MGVLPIMSFMPIESLFMESLLIVSLPPESLLMESLPIEFPPAESLFIESLLAEFPLIESLLVESLPMDMESPANASWAEAARHSETSTGANLFMQFSLV